MLWALLIKADSVSGLTLPKNSKVMCKLAAGTGRIIPAGIVFRIFLQWLRACASGARPKNNRFIAKLLSGFCCFGLFRLLAGLFPRNY